MRRRNHLQLALGLERLDIACLQIDDKIGVATLDQVGAGRRLRHRLHDDALEVGRLVGRATVPGLVAHHDHLFARLEGLDLVGTAAGGVLFQPRRRPGIVWRRMFLGDLGVEDNRIDGGKVGQRQLVRLRQRHLDGQGIDHLELVGGCHRPREQLRLAEHRRRHDPVERPFDVISSDRRAVLELGILAQVKNHLQPVRADLISFRQLSRDRAEIEHPFAVELLAAEGNQSIIRAQTDRKGFAGRTRNIRVERIDRCAGDIAQRFAARLCLHRSGGQRTRDKGNHRDQTPGSCNAHRPNSLFCQVYFLN